jgi:hypothetical protein
MFPFITSESPHGRRSQIQPEEMSRTETIWSLFLRMIWHESDLETLREELEELTKDADDETKAYGALWTAMADPRFRHK